MKKKITNKQILIAVSAMLIIILVLALVFIVRGCDTVGPNDDTTFGSDIVTDGTGTSEDATTEPDSSESDTSEPDESTDGGQDAPSENSDTSEEEPSEDPGETTEPSEKPVVTEPAKTDPVKTEPAKTEPAKTQPVQTQPVATEPVATQPVQTNAPVTEPAPVVTEPQTDPNWIGAPEVTQAATVPTTPAETTKSPWDMTPEEKEAAGITITDTIETIGADGRKVVRTFYSDGTVITVAECEYCHEFPCPNGSGENCPQYDIKKDGAKTCQQCGRPKGNGYNGTCLAEIDWDSGKTICNHYDE